MKKLLFTLCLAAVSLTTFAQDDKPVTYGIKGGVNFSQLVISASGSSFTVTSGTLTSFHAGFFADIKSGENLSIQPALYFKAIGGKFDGTDEEAQGSVKTTLNYIQLPVNLVYNTPIGIGKLYFGAGPFLGYAISGKEKASYTDGEQSASESQDAEFGDGAYKRPNFGINGLLGIKLQSGLMFDVNYDLGLSNIVDSDQAKMKTKVFGISIGYAF